MAKLLHTIWALLLNIFGLQIFRTCFANAMEDEDCESLLSGPPFSSVFFSIGIYVIIVNSTLFPRSFHAPKIVFLILYEFLATAFILEFALACIWTPIDVLLSTTLPSCICYVILRSNIPYDIRKRILRRFGLEDAAVSFLTNKSWTIVLTYTASITFLILTLHVVDAVDYIILRDYGTMCFLTHVREKLWARVEQEFPFLIEETKACRCKVRRRSSRRSNSKSGVNSSR